MKCGSRVLACYPPLYPSTCEKCGKTENLRDLYPRIVHKEIMQCTS